MRHQIVVKAASVTTDVGAAVAQEDPHALSHVSQAVSHAARLARTFQ
jgi:hypothetical protein